MGNKICCCAFLKCKNTQKDATAEIEQPEIVTTQPTPSTAENRSLKRESPLVLIVQSQGISEHVNESNKTLDTKASTKEIHLVEISRKSYIPRVDIKGGARIKPDETLNFEHSTRIEPIVPSDTDFIIRNIKNYATCQLNWQYYDKDLVSLLQVSPNSREFDNIADMFYDTSQHLEIIRIDRIQNPFLLAAFLLKREEMKRRIGFQTIKRLFHGTLARNVREISQNNFDWRLRDKEDPVGFGDGIYFTPSAYHASFYGDNNPYKRVMLLVHVLVGKTCIGNWNMILPESGTDTSVKGNRNEFVKYEDNEFYPAYKITYRFDDVRVFYRQQWKKKQFLASRSNEIY